MLCSIYPFPIGHNKLQTRTRRLAIGLFAVIVLYFTNIPPITVTPPSGQVIYVSEDLGTPVDVVTIQRAWENVKRAYKERYDYTSGAALVLHLDQGLFESPYVTFNALSGRYEIHITLGTIISLDISEPELAAILAHEMGHLYGGHLFTPSVFYAKHEQEDMADLYAMNTVKLAGYPCLAGAYFFAKLVLTMGPGQIPGDVHSSHITRMYRMEQQCNAQE